MDSAKIYGPVENRIRAVVVAVVSCISRSRALLSFK